MFFSSWGLVTSINRPYLICHDSVLVSLIDEEGVKTEALCRLCLEIGDTFPASFLRSSFQSLYSFPICFTLYSLHVMAILFQLSVRSRRCGPSDTEFRNRLFVWVNLAFRLSKFGFSVFFIFSCKFGRVFGFFYFRLRLRPLAFFPPLALDWTGGGGALGAKAITTAPAVRNFFRSAPLVRLATGSLSAASSSAASSPPASVYRLIILFFSA